LIDDTLLEADEKMDKAVSVAKESFAAIRTGRAHPGMFARVVVEYYGTVTPLNQLAGFTVADARMIVISPYDKGSLRAIEKAIRDSDLGLNPQSQGGVIRVPLPSLNEDRRKELVKVVHRLAEDGRIGVRHARTVARDAIKKLDKAPEDDKKAADKELQRAHDEHIARLEAMLKSKEAEIMEV